MEVCKRSIYAVTHRPLETLKKYHYGDMLDISWLRGKTVLDVGSGESPFVKELRKNKVNAVSIDMYDLSSPNKGAHVRGYADKMPFKKKFLMLYIPPGQFLHIQTNLKKFK